MFIGIVSVDQIGELLKIRPGVGELDPGTVNGEDPFPAAPEFEQDGRLSKSVNSGIKQFFEQRRTDSLTGFETACFETSGKQMGFRSMIREMFWCSACFEEYSRNMTT